MDRVMSEEFYILNLVSCIIALPIMIYCLGLIRECNKIESNGKRETALANRVYKQCNELLEENDDPRKM